MSRMSRSRLSALANLVFVVLYLGLCSTSATATDTYGQLYGERYDRRFGQYPQKYETPPHIIVFMIDDLGWNDIGFHGSDQIPTPNIDALAYNGIILNKHYVLPSSTPSRAAFYTGMYPIRMGMQGEGIRGGEPRGLPLDIAILPQRLQALGYTTKLIGKWHIGYHAPEYTPLHRGFDSFFGFYNSHVSYYDFKYSSQNMSGYDLHRGDNPAYVGTRDYATDVFTDEANNIIRNHDPSRPLYLQISHLAVHTPLQEPENIAREFYYIPNEDRRKYAHMVKHLDDSIGHVVNALAEKRLLKDSVILLLTDNGAPADDKQRNWGSNYPLRGSKYTLYEGGVRGVAALWSPRLRRDARVFNKLIHITDWLPTLYSAAGGNVTKLGDIDGIDQWQVLSEGVGTGRDQLLLNIDEIQQTEGAIYKQYKLLRGAASDGYDGYFGDSGVAVNNTGQPPYLETVLYSPVSASISSVLGSAVTQTSTMGTLRNEASVQCRSSLVTHPSRRRGEHGRVLGRPRSYRERTTDCTRSECLFDLLNDPCEERNVIEQYPDAVKELHNILDKYSRLLKKQVKVPIDWQADPSKKNNTWEPWMKSGTSVYDYTNAAALPRTLTWLPHAIIIYSIVFLFRAFP